MLSLYSPEAQNTKTWCRELSSKTARRIEQQVSTHLRPGPNEQFGVNSGSRLDGREAPESDLRAYVQAHAFAYSIVLNATGERGEIMRNAVCGCFVGVTLSVSPCFADAFCDGVNKVIGASHDSFASLRGRADRADKHWYHHPLFLLPGAQGRIPGIDCWVYVPDGGAAQYTCNFFTSGTAERMLADRDTLVGHVASCLSVPMPPLKPGIEGAWGGAYEFAVRQVHVRAALAVHPDGGAQTALDFSPDQ